MPRHKTRKTGTMDAVKAKESTLNLSYPTLTKANYTAWSLKMRVFMQAHGIWDAIEPKDPKATADVKVDKMAMAAIYQAIPEDILLSVAEKKTAKEVWTAIKTMCLGADKVKKAKVQTLKAEFENLIMKETESIDDFSMKMNDLVTNIRTLGETVEENYVVKKFLRAMPSKFLQITSSIEQFGDLEQMSVEEIIGSLKAHEERLRGQVENTGGQLLLTEEEWLKKESTEGQLLFTREEWMKRKKGGTEQSQGLRYRGNSSNQGGRDRSKVRCFNCSLVGHYAVECRRPRRDREPKAEVNLSQVQDDEPALLVAEREIVPNLNYGAKNCSESASNLWYLDNGASNHMTGDRSKFRELDEGVTGLVKFGDGSTVEIKGKGSILFKGKTGEELLFREVYFIPTLCNNIISLGQLSENGNKVVLNGNYLWVYDGNGRLIMNVKRSENRLYKIVIETSKSTCLLSKSEELSWRWHSRLGHVNFQAMIWMSKNKMAYGLPDFVHPKTVCTGC